MYFLVFLADVSVRYHARVGGERGGKRKMRSRGQRKVTFAVIGCHPDCGRCREDQLVQRG